MKIHVRSSKRASPPHPEIAALVANIAATPQDELADLLASFPAWVWPRSDLHAWIGVLNLFDGILEGIISSYAVDKLQVNAFAPPAKNQLQEILRFERMLLENSTNRKLFSSYDRLNALLASSDLDVVVSVLQLLLRPAQQYSSQPAVTQVLNISSGRLESLSRRWSNLRDYGLDVSDLVSPKKREEVDQLPPVASDLKFTFYRRALDSNESPAEPESSEAAAPPQTPARKPSGTAAAQTNGANVVYLPAVATSTQDPMLILAEIIEAHDIPESERFELMCKIRTAWALGKGREAEREKLVVIRILAIALYAHTQSESHAQSALFLYEPDLVTHLAELLQLDRDVSIAVQSAAIAALDGLVRYRLKMQEVLTAVNVGVNHGLLMALLRTVVADIAKADSTTPSSFIEAILSFVSYIASHASGGNMIVGAGLVPLLIQVIDIELPSRLSVVSKTMSLLDSVLYGFTNSFSIFCNARGVETLVTRIEHEVDLDIQEHEAQPTSGLSVARSNVLKHLLRSVHRMMQSPGTTEGLRGLIDSSLPKSLKKIFVHKALFGPVVLPLATNIMSTFVHNEPTSLAIMQEQGLPEAFYDTIDDGLEASIEVLQAIPNAIGALCLNQAGQDQLAARPTVIPKLFETFTSEKHIKVLHEKENAMVMGSAVDELIRHHPNLKTTVFASVIATLAKIEELGNAYVEPTGAETPFKLQLVPRPVDATEQQDAEMSQAIAMELGQPRPPTPIPAAQPDAAQNTVGGNQSTENVEYMNKQPDVFDNIIVSYVDVIGRFLEGLFQHTPHCRDFVANTDGLERLGRLFTLPAMPFDFGSTEYFLQVIRTIAEVTPTQTLQKLTQHVKMSLEETKDIWQSLGAKAKLTEWTSISTTSTLADANVRFRQLVTLNTRVTMLAEVYSATSIAHGRSASTSLQNITATETAALIPMLGDLHRSFIWENILLKSALPPTSLGNAVHSMEFGSVPIDLLPEGFPIASTAQPESTSSAATDETPAPAQSAAAAKAESAKRHNIAAIKQLAGQIPTAVTSFLQALIKMALSGRRNVDSTHKKQASQIAALLADVLVKHLAWRGADEVNPLAVSAYHTVMLGFFSVLLCGENPSQSSLQTLLLVTLWRVGAVQTVVDIAQEWVTTADSIMLLKPSERSDSQNQALVHSFGGLKVALHLLHTMTSSKLLFESTQTPVLITRDVKDTEPNYFEPHDLLIKLRATTLPLIKRLWTDAWVSGPPLSITRSIVQNMLEIMRADREDASSDAFMGPSAVGSGRHVAAQVGPDENLVRHLGEMGFPRSAAERALIRMGNNVSAATEYLLSHPFSIAAPGRGPMVDEADEDDAEDDADPQDGPSSEPAAADAEAASVPGDGEAPAPAASEDAEMHDVEPSANVADKGKGKEVEPVVPQVPAKTRQEWKDELDAARAEIREYLVQHAFKLVDEHPNLIFDVKSAFLNPNGGNSPATALKVIVEDVKNFSPSAYDVHEQPLAVRLRLLGLVLTDSTSSITRLSTGEAREVMNVLLALILSQEPSSDNASSPPKWLGALLLVAELLLGLADEPSAVTLPSDEEEIETRPLSSGPDYSDARTKLFDFAFSLLQTPELSREDLLASLRLLVLLTRDSELASEFVKRDGLPRLIQLFHESPKTVAGLEVYVAILMRHAVEDSKVLRTVMTQEIRRFFGQTRGRVVDMTTFMRGASHLVLRDPKAFMDATSAMCVLTGSSWQHIVLKPSTETAGTAQDAPVQSGGEMQVDDTPPVLESRSLETVVHFLVSELMKVSRPALTFAVSGPASSTTAAVTTPSNVTQQDTDAGEAAATDPSPGAPAPDIRNDHAQEFAYACFLMQCLTELLFSYEVCKSAFLSYSRSKSATPSKEGKSKPTVLHFLLHDMISYGELTGHSASEGSRRRMLLCNWAASVVVALSVDVSPVHDLKEISTDLVAVRKNVIDAVNKAIKESSPTETVAARYGRLMAMAELCYRLLTVKVHPANKTHEDVAIHTSKIMLEKGFVATLTNALAEVDLNYPNVKNLISAILRPLEYLTRIAIKMGKTSERAKAGEEKDEDAMSTDVSDDEEEDEDMDREETPDLYRNSALGMYGGEMEDVNFVDEDDEMDEDDDMIEEGAEFDDEPGSEHTSATDSDEDDDPDGDELDIEEAAGSEDGWQDEDEEMEDEEDGDGEGTDDEGEDGDEEMVWEDVPDGEGGIGEVADELDEEDIIEPVLPGMGDGADDDGDMGSDADDPADDLSILEPADALQAAADDPFAAHWFGAMAGDPTARNGPGVFAVAPRRRGVDIDAELQMFGRRHAPAQGADVTTHPLLVDPAAAPAGSHGHRARSRGPRGAVTQYHDLLAAVEEVVGGGAYQFLQQFIQRTRPGDTFQLELPAGALSQLERGSSRHAAQRIFSSVFPHFPHRPHRHEPKVEHIELQPQPTSARWAEEIQITHGKSVPERVERLSNHVALRLLPAARQAARVAKAKEEEEQRAAEEREDAARAEAARAAATASPPPAPAPVASSSTDEAGGSPVPGSAPESEATRDAVMSDDVTHPSSTSPLLPSDAQLVDSAASAIESISVSEHTDATPPVAPESTPAPSSAAETSEVANTSVPEQSPEPEAGPSQQPARVVVTINGAEVDITDTGIDPEFLEALPDDMREEVISQHFRERGMAQQPIPADSQISAEFLEALPPEIRAELLHQESVERRRAQTAQATTVANTGPSDIDPASFLASLDPHLRQTVLLEQDDVFLQTLPSNMIAEAGAYRDAAQSRRFAANLASLTAAEPVPSGSRRPAVQRDAIQLLDRSGIATLVRLLYFPQVSKKSLLHKVLVNICENSKSRTELLNLLLGILHEGTGELLAVDKSFAQLSVRSGKTPSYTTPKATPKPKGSGDSMGATQILSQLPSESIPNLVAQRSLEALSFIVSNNELASLFFLSEQDQPAGLRRSTSRKGKGKEKQTSTVHYPVVALLGLLDRQLVLKTVTIMDSVASLLAIVTKPLTGLKKPDPPSADAVPTAVAVAAPAPAASETQDATSDSAPDAPAVPEPAVVTEPKPPAVDDGSSALLSRPPTIPHNVLRLIVNILTGGECSSRTFQHSLALIQNLACLPDSRDTIASELRSRAQDLGTSIYMDLDELVKQLEGSATSNAATTIAVKFSPASSDQAKLLRVLKTIDYMYSPRSSPEAVGDERSQDDANKLNAVYETFKFSSLWRRLGDVLAIVQENPDVEHTSTVLLPLIESLMVVCKNVGATTGRAVRATSPRSPVTPRESMDELFVSFTDAHRKVLNLMVRNNPSLMSGSFSLLVHNPRVLDFDNKRNYFNQQLHRRPANREHHGTLQLNVRRARVFEDSFQYLQRRTGEQIKYGKLSVRFYDEEGVDAGGVTREWFQILARQMFNPDYCLFQPCAADKLTYQPNRASAVNPEHLSFFKFVGRVIGKAIYDGRLLDAYFARSLYRQLLAKPVDYRDVEWVDPSYYNSLCWLLENDPAPLDMTFSIEAEEFGVTKVIPLKENGASIPVTIENRREFVQLAAEYRLYSSIKDQIESLLAGFYEIIPKDLVSIFNEQELELLISGTPDIDVDEWRAATEYNGYSASDPVIVWWWRALKSFSRDERAKVLSFATGTSRVPLGGFVDLQGVQGVQRFSIHKAYGGTDRLPQAHTCFNQVDLPQYSSYEMLRTQVLLAINEGGEGFGFA
ncbi:hypothetical protein EXIGLDRAFT_644511 [Exidia glandulosa HHB12029]|uniref:HECT-type E3 ubiquitin transferase n=1 Tax=Exidia glandulosa HHB12029 TaxID=1314781 RepID=A0A165JNC9_EXIGL|nr:hypothetical protein EXIGLDRAFT_644511 [Exidia glandulosa HHB12029]